MSSRKKISLFIRRNYLTSIGTGISASVIIFVIGFSLFTQISPFTPFQPYSSDHYVIDNTYKTSFGQYTPINPVFTPSITPTQIASDLGNVDISGFSLTNQQKALLAQYGFFLKLSNFNSLNELYDSFDASPKFITADLALTSFHNVFDYSLRFLEVHSFIGDFRTLLTQLRSDQENLLSSSSNSVLQTIFHNNIAYLSVILSLLDNSTSSVPSYVLSEVQQELNNINGQIPAYSAIFGYEEDFSQYIPRGHYTRSAEFENYFKAMMYTGRMTFLTKGSLALEQTRMAIALVLSFDKEFNSNNLWPFWNSIYDCTSFYVGFSDDLTPPDYLSLITKLDISLNNLDNDTLIQSYINEANSLDHAQIVPDETVVGFRLMGQRFIPDSYIFQELVHDKVENRLMPNALDILSVLHSHEAEVLMQPDNQTYADYSVQINKLRDEFDAFNTSDWTQNLYWLWIYSLIPLLNEDRTGYPGFMQNTAWTIKSLMTTLGSWSELRHDTILYAKQSGTKLTSISFPHGYVEPYPDLYARLQSLASMLRDGLASRDLLIPELDTKLQLLTSVYGNLTRFSIMELENQELSQDDYNYINRIPKIFAGIVNFDLDVFQNIVSDTDSQMAIIADVHTDPNTGNVLEVGTGVPFLLFAVVQDNHGNLRLTVGGTYSYYEFQWPLNDRLTDETWHDMLAANTPVLPTWLQDGLPLS